MSRPVAIPDIPPGVEPGVRRVLDAMKQRLEQLSGERGGGAPIGNGAVLAAMLAELAVATHLGYTPQKYLGYTPVNKAGDTMSGPLTLSGDPTAAMHAATKQYLDARRGKAVMQFGHEHDASAAGNQTVFLPGATTDWARSGGFLVPFRCMVRNLHCSDWNGPGTGESSVYTVQQNEGDTVLTATVSGSATPAMAANTVNAVEFAKGHRIRVKVARSALAGNSWLRATVELEEIIP